MLPEQIKTIKNFLEFSFKEKASEFIAIVYPVDNEESALNRLNEIRKKYFDASHHCYAYKLKSGEEKYSDDGEPKGTAGLRILNAIEHFDLSDVLAIVVRYFGGTKLGTGGLVRAYSEAVRRVVEAVPRAERVATHTVMVALPYRLLERVRQAAGMHHGQVLDEVFAADVTLTVLFPQEDLSAFQHALQDLSSGTLQAELIESGERLVRIK